jgi:hypothetical protein
MEFGSSCSIRNRWSTKAAAGILGVAWQLVCHVETQSNIGHRTHRYTRSKAKSCKLATDGSLFPPTMDRKNLPNP